MSTRLDLEFGVIYFGGNCSKPYNVESGGRDTQVGQSHLYVEVLAGLHSPQIPLQRAAPRPILPHVVTLRHRPLIILLLLLLHFQGFGRGFDILSG